IYEVQKYMTITDHAPTTYPVLTNKTFWDDLPDDVRDELESIIKEVNEEVATEAENVEKESLNTIKEEGDMEIYELDEDEKDIFRDKLSPLYEQYEEIIGDDLINKALDF